MVVRGMNVPRLLYPSSIDRNLGCFCILAFKNNAAGEWEGEGGEKVQRISSIDDRWKIDRGRVRIV